MIICVDFPPSTNTLFATFNGRRLLSEKARDYAKHVAEAVSYSSAKLPIEGRLSVSILLQRGDRRKYDIANYEKAVIDSLQKCGVFEDDEAIDELEIRRGPIIDGGLCTVDVRSIKCQWSISLL